MGHRTREPSLDELLADPIAQLLMERDGVEEREVRQILDEARRHARADAEEHDRR